MTVNSKFVLRWEIDNARARFATGNVESDVFLERGFKWTAAINHHGTNVFYESISVSLRCDRDIAPWTCSGRVGVHMFNPGGIEDSNFYLVKEEPFSFSPESKRFHEDTRHAWFILTSPLALRNDKVIVEFTIDSFTSMSGRFASRNNKQNVILVIGDEKLLVFKEVLSLNSPVFRTMFNGDFAENGKEEVEIKDVAYEEFVDLLRFMFPGNDKITDQTVIHLLKLADRFLVEHVIELSKEHLMATEGIDIAKKLLIADQYRLDDLKDCCLKSFTTIKDFGGKLKSSPEFTQLSGDMKIAIYDRLVELGMQ